MQRHFPYKHPTFGTARNPKKPSAWRSSVYYWWWEYLKRNRDYIETCERGGEGKYAALYRDFGDVRTITFKEWWLHQGRAVHLFAEPPTPTITVVSENSQGLSFGSDAVVLAVPLNLPIKHLVERFRKIISSQHAGRRGVRSNLQSQARYRVTGKVDLAFLEDALQVWDARKENPKKPWWQIAQDLKLGSRKNWITDTNDLDATAKKNILAATASRLYRKAELIVFNTANGIFPRSN